MAKAVTALEMIDVKKIRARGCWQHTLRLSSVLMVLSKCARFQLWSSRKMLPYGRLAQQGGQRGQGGGFSAQYARAQRDRRKTPSQRSVFFSQAQAAFGT